MAEAQKQSHMLYVDGGKKSWRCPGGTGERCGANVFTKVEEADEGTVFKCNACGREWLGERKKV